MGTETERAVADSKGEGETRQAGSGVGAGPPVPSGNGSPEPGGAPSEEPQQKRTSSGRPEEEQLSIDEVMEKLDTSKDGLSQSEAQDRLEKYGANELEEEKQHPVLIFLSYFWGPIPWMIEIAAILSAVVRHWADLAIIAALLLVNACVGFWEEYQANTTVQELKEELAPEARVRRDGEWKHLPSRELVPGDIVRLRLGEIIPADAKLLEGDPIEVDESALTGESLPVEHETGDVVFSGSVMQQGEIEGVVYATGADTFFGKTAELVESAGKSQSHFQKAVLKIGDYLIGLAIGLALIIIIVSLFRGNRFIQTLQFVLVLTVAAVPVAMPTVLTVTMAVGARLLARSQAIVTRLASIEELAGVDVLCSDKTGTLTQNKLKLGEPFTVDDVSAGDAVLAGALASREEDGDPIDLAVLAGLDGKSLLDSYEVTSFVPFDPVHKRTEATVKDKDGNEFRVTKGAPQVILGMASDKGGVQGAAGEAIDDFASHGYRSLGVARADRDDDWRFLGILPLSDPPREDSKDMLEAAKKMGVRAKMVTGDQVAIAKDIAEELGLGSNILGADTIEEAGDEHMDSLADKIEEADGFAQVFPEHKYKIVEALQRHNHIVGMTGDGVNDAPPLKRADAGIAVSGATDAARSAADIVLLKPGLSVIIDALKESRRIFQRMNNYAIYRITETIRVLFFMTASILVFNFYPVTAIMIVLLALLNDGAIISIAYDRVRYSDKPETWNMHDVLWLATMLGTLGVIETFGIFYLFDRVFHLSRPVIQSLIYLKLSVAGHLTVFVARTRGPFWSIKPARVLLYAVIGTQAVATFLVVYGLFMHAAGWMWAGFVWGYCLIWFFIEDRAKLVTYGVMDPTKSALSELRRFRPRKTSRKAGV